MTKKALTLEGNLTLLAIRSLNVGETLVVTEKQYQEASGSVLSYTKQKEIKLAIISRVYYEE